MLFEPLSSENIGDRDIEAPLDAPIFDAGSENLPPEMSDDFDFAKIGVDISGEVALEFQPVAVEDKGSTEPVVVNPNNNSTYIPTKVELVETAHHVDIESFQNIVNLGMGMDTFRATRHNTSTEQLPPDLRPNQGIIKDLVGL